MATSTSKWTANEWASLRSCGPTRVQRGVWKNGWTLPELRGQKFPVSVDFGTGAVTTAIVERRCDHGLLKPTRMVYILQEVWTGTMC